MNNPLQNTLLGGSLYYVVLPNAGVKVLLESHVSSSTSDISQKKMHSHLSLNFCTNGFYMYVQMGPKKDFKPIVHKNTEA